MDIHQLEHIDLSTSLVLAIMATLGYVFGTLAQRRKTGTSEVLLRMKMDLSRANAAVVELEKAIRTIRNSTTEHHSRLKKFQRWLTSLEADDENVVWHELRQEIEGILSPTLQFVSEITSAQERIRHQTDCLMTFSEIRTDSLTGLGNRRALEHALGTQLTLLNRYETPFSLMVIDIDRFKSLNDEQGHLYGDQMLRELAALLTSTLRSVDIPARYGGDEFVVVMPQTDLAGAEVLGDRVRAVVEQETPYTISVGVASADCADTPESLFHRADAALYRAKTDGRNRMCSDPHHRVENVAPRSLCCNTLIVPVVRNSPATVCQ